MPGLPPGKVPVELLERYVFKRIGVGSASVLLGPSYGEDSAVVSAGGFTFATHVDPVTAASRLAGWLSVHVACNDVAVTGAEPRWLLTVILLPEGAGEGLLDELTGQVDRAAREVGAMVVGGHTEVTPGLGRPIIVTTAIGAVAGGYVTTGGARPGDVVVMTKTAAVEGTAVLATDFEAELKRRGVPGDVVEAGKRYLERVSVVREALQLAGYGLATSMHDPTEGGILGGLAEIAHASGVRVVVREEDVPVSRETRLIAEALGVDPLRLLGSGSLLATVPGDRVGEALEVLGEAGVKARVIGRVLEAPPGGAGVELVRRDGRVERLPRLVQDEVYKLF
ncbi:AIR synthase family protein [Stetteria hydrogenophila]